MRRIGSRFSEAEEESAIDITPMLDVVFIMLIFFIVTATFVKESWIEVNKADAATAVKQEKANILIAINANNQIYIDRRNVDVRRVRPVVERLHAENPQGSVVIQADKESKMDIFVKVWDAAKEAGVDNIAIAAQPKG